MFEFVEPRVRRVVAEQLGVSPDELSSDVSLTDELAADSLDLLELALALEMELGIVIPESTIDELRTYGELLDIVRMLARRRREAEVRARGSEPALVWARVYSPLAEERGEIQRACWLTPYTAETIAEDALRAGRGARLEVAVPSTLSDASVAALQDEFAWLGDRGVEVSVRRDHHLGPLAQRPHPHAAASGA
jgi:acyl carrier protein